MNILKNKYFILGNILLLLAIIPITLFVVKKQTDLQSVAAPTTTLSFEPATVSATIGQNFSLDIYADPGENFLNTIKMSIHVDPDLLEIVSLEKNADKVPVTVSGPTIDNALGTAVYSVGATTNIEDTIQEKTKIATLTLKPKSVTTGASTLVTFIKDESEVYSSANADGEGENVLNSVLSSSVTISTDGEANPTPTTGGGANPTGGPTPTTGGGANPTSTPIPTGVSTITPTPTIIAASQNPVCTGLFLDRAASGTAPYALVFTASGNHPSGTISKVKFNFGDGVIQEVTQAGGVGTANVNVQIAHTYNNAGTYPATVVLSDSAGSVSEATTCSQTITVAEAVASGSGGTTTTGGGTTTTETVPATGIIETSLAIIGVVGVLIATGVFFLL